MTQRVWLAIRFVVFGIGGFVLMMIFSLDLTEQTIAHNRSLTNTKPLVSAMLMIVGVVSILFGVGEWKRWAYVSVFLSIPATFAILTVLPNRFTDWLSLPILAAILVSVAWTAFVLSRRHYRRRDNAERTGPGNLSRLPGR